MNNRFLWIAFAAFLLVSCAQNAVTGRKQVLLYKEEDIQAMALQEYKKFISSSQVLKPTTSKEAERVVRIGKRLSMAIQQYYSGKGQSQLLEGFQWEYSLVKSEEINAWCLPGGKIVVYTGLLPVVENDRALAVVMGHEIAHALAKHGNERLSQSTLQQLGGVALSVAVAGESQAAQEMLLDAYGIGTTLGGILPFSRKHELEADKLGLIYAALAGYDPREAIPLWERMEKSAKGNKPPEFLSTHPNEENRIERLKKIIPEALVYYKPDNQ